MVDRTFGPKGCGRLSAAGCVRWRSGEKRKGSRVQKVQRVLPASGRRVQRVVVSPLRGDEVL